MKIIGLTGGIACGKSTIASLLKSMGAFVVDADAINDQLTAPGGEALPLIEQAFGEYVFYPDGTLNRPVLSSIVFQNEEALQRLNAATHPLIQEAHAGGDRNLPENGRTGRCIGCSSAL